MIITMNINEALRRREKLQVEMEPLVESDYRVRRLVNGFADLEKILLSIDETKKQNLIDKQQSDKQTFLRKLEDDNKRIEVMQAAERQWAERKRQDDAAYLARQADAKSDFADRQLSSLKVFHKQQEQERADLDKALVERAPQSSTTKVDREEGKPVPDEHAEATLEAGKSSIGLGYGRTYEAAVRNSASAARDRDRVHELDQADLKAEATEKRAKGDFTSAKIAELQGVQRQKAYEGDVWNDVANKEFVLRGDTQEYQDARKSAEEAYAEADKVCPIIGRERELAAEQAKGIRPDRVDTEALNGINWRVDPFRHDLAQQREADLRAVLPPAERAEAEVRDVHAEAKSLQRDTALYEKVNATADDKEARTADAERDTRGCQDASTRWQTIANLEGATYGRTASYIDAEQRSRIAHDAASESHKRKRATQSQSESEGEKSSVEHVPPFSHRAPEVRFDNTPPGVQGASEAREKASAKPRPVDKNEAFSREAYKTNGQSPMFKDNSFGARIERRRAMGEPNQESCQDFKKKQGDYQQEAQERALALQAGRTLK